MQVERYDDPASWLDDVTPLLLIDEPRHNLAFGIADRLINQPGLYPEHRLWTVTLDGSPVGAMLQTPPYPLILAAPAADGVIEALVEAAAPFAATVPGANGVRPEIEAFTSAWATRTGAAARVALAMGIYACRHASEVPVASGAARLAGPEDMDRIFPLILAFFDEAMRHTDVRDREREERTTRESLDTAPEFGGMWVWEDDGRIVSVSGHGGRTPNGIRIGPVYTPPACRSRGYATSLVREQTAWLLTHAVEICFLYADLQNPTSNAMYRRIGYEQVAEAAEYRFEPQVQSGGSGA